MLTMKSRRTKKIVIAIIMGLIFVVFIIVHQSNQPQDIPFSVFEEGYSLVAPPGFPQREPEPQLIIIASQEDMDLPSMLAFPEPVAERMMLVDFRKSFLILVHRGHPDRGLVKAVARQRDKVFITTYDVIAGPGNYVVEGWTQPYEFIKIDKGDKWDEQIRFILQRETQGVLGEAVHYIP